MSDVLFQTEDEVAVLAAAERARAATLIDDLALGLLAPQRPAVAHRLHELLRPDHFLRLVPVDDPRWVEEFQAAFSGHVDAGLICPEGRPLDTFALALNTAVLVGNDCLRMLAWLHAECEPHGYLEPAQLGWVADLVDEGLSTGLLRAQAGWPGVVALLRRADGPVVLSVAGHGAFPEAAPEGAGAPWADTRAADDGGPPPDPGDWAAAMARLRADAGLAPLDPATIRQPYGHGLTVLDLIAPDWTERLARAATPAT